MRTRSLFEYIEASDTVIVDDKHVCTQMLEGFNHGMPIFQLISSEDFLFYFRDDSVTVSDGATVATTAHLSGQSFPNKQVKLEFFKHRPVVEDDLSD